MEAIEVNSTPSPEAFGRASPRDEPLISVTVTLGGQTHAFHLPASYTFDDLTVECEDKWGSEYDWTSHKFIAPPPIGLLKASSTPPDFVLAPLDGKKLRLMASKRKDVDALKAAEQHAQRIADHRAAAAARHHHHHRPHKHRDPARARDDATYTFLQLRALPGLPNPQRSLAFLARLRDDPGIRAAMRAHRFSVGLLTEMDPLSYTRSSHEGTTRVLGLNRNRGEVIELRLRTDAYDGYRNYKIIRKTLCHELAHNVHGDHDRDFWDLCHQIEREVDRADWKSGGRTISGEETYDPGERDEDVMDHGGWTGGEFVLGSGEGGSTGASAAATAGLSRREILAKAAEERIRRMNQADEERVRRVNQANEPSPPKDDGGEPPK